MEMTTGEKLGCLRGKWYKWMPVLYFLAVLTLYLTMLTDFVFVDEVDVFYGGYNVVFSGDIYKVYPSQHMPFSYYMSAICALFGATTAYQFRLGLYIMMAGIWTATYVHHRKYLNNWALLGLPCFYIFQLKQVSLATAMISDHWQGIGLVLLILEVLRYRKTWRIPFSSAVFVSLGIVLSLGTAFVSAYSVFAVFVGVLLMQAFRLWKHPEERKIALREDLRLAGVGIAPFAVLILWYLASGNLQNFFGGAYELNVNIYSKYIGGFGTEAGGTFLSTFPGWISYIQKSIDWLSSSVVYGTMLVLQNVSLVIFSIVIMRKHFLAGATVLIASILAGVRAFDGFHGAPFMAVCSVPMAFWLGTGLVRFAEKRNVLRGANLLAALAAVVILVAPSVKSPYYLKYVPQYLAPSERDEYAQTMAEVLTDEGDRIMTDDISYTSWMVMRDHLKLEECSTAPANPWFYEYYGARALEKLKENKTAIVSLYPDSVLWGYRTRDYAADFVQYVEENYLMLEPGLYILKEKMPEMMRKLSEAGYGMTDRNEELPSFSELGDPLLPGEEMGELFTARGCEMCAARVLTATYFGGNTIGLTCTLTDAETGEELASVYRGKQYMVDNDYTRFPMRVKLEPGKQYMLRIRADGETSDGSEKTRLHIYRSGEGTATENDRANAGGIPLDYCLGVRIEYAVDEAGRILGKTEEQQ